MDVFDLRDRLVREYSRYVESFIAMRDGRIRDRVAANLGRLWPEPSIGLNPAFEPGGYVDELVSEGLLHRDCGRVFRVGKGPDDAEGQPMRLYRHQVDAIRTAATGASYVLTTGTGSGKSLAYMVPIVDHVLRRGSGGSVKAIVVYPMNALANSQYQELGKFLDHGFSGRRPVRVGRYTGQESAEDREVLLRDPPDVVLTNYVMLELILTRVRDQALVRGAEGLRFLVLDELHTYRGRQGADVSLLVRRAREACRATELQCIGTSATLASQGSHTDQQAAVAGVASRIFGTPVEPDHVIGETLRRATRPVDLADPAVQSKLAERVRQPDRVSATFEELIGDPLSSWIETTFGVDLDDERLVRRTPRPIGGPEGAARELAELTGEPSDRCAGAVRAQLLAGCRIPHPETGFPTFAFRVHQFVSKGDTVYASLDGENDRHSTLKGQRFVPGHRDRILLPLAFCRLCGQEYYVVTRVTGTDDTPTRYEPRAIDDQVDLGAERSGFLVLAGSEDEPIWPDGPEEAKQRLPEDWLEPGNGGLRIRDHYRSQRPQRVRVDGEGRHVDQGGTPMWWTPTPFRLCLRCGASYPGTQRSDIAKLATLGSEGRSTATTVLSLSAVRGLRRDEELEESARKLLSFTDNRQDASLQAGHFNDFVLVLLLRAALHRALIEAGPDGLEHDRVAQAVFRALDLPYADYARNPDADFGPRRRETERALRDVLGYHVYRDLRRGWRLMSPNLEQCGLLRIEYVELAEVCARQEVWNDSHAVLREAAPDEREDVVHTLLDHLRQDLAIKVGYLDQEELERIQQRSGQQLTGRWALDEQTTPEYARWAIPRSRQHGEPGAGAWTFVSARGGFGRYLRRPGTFPSNDTRLGANDVGDIIVSLFAALRRGGLLDDVGAARDGTLAYQVPASVMVWRAGDGTERLRDPVRMPSAPRVPLPINPYFLDLYRQPSGDLVGVEAREHTAQVPYPDREEREQRFRKADLPVLYCSPTMELGVDIADLNVVGLRNVPPTPANYAQRSGRAGRQGQPALVLTYCSSGSPHDQWYFERPQLMVAGQVSLPRLDLANEDLVRAHVHAVWLAASGLSLGTSLTEVLDLRDDSTEAELNDEVRRLLHDRPARDRARQSAERVLADLVPELEQTSWWGPGWLDDVLDDIPQSFEAATQRWRSLYRSAMTQAQTQSRIIRDMSASAADQNLARHARRQAETQLELLKGGGDAGTYSDFYSYRYFASEGFLPGYSFPRLPLSAFIPGRRWRTSDREGEFVSRPRFLAISEFGPRSLVYHEGNRYEIERVILPVSDHTDSSGEPALTIDAKQCARCGYLHAGVGLAADRCEHCDVLLPGPLHGLLRMQNVATRRRERINSDEEERQRQGFEIRTAFRFAERNGRLSARPAEIEGAEGESLGQLTYGDTVTLWRINVGRRRRAVPERLGYRLDVDRGRWLKEGDEAADGDAGRNGSTHSEPGGVRARRVLPLVEDTRNCLLLRLATPQPDAVMASVQTALKHAIQLVYQLEDGELAAEPLPNRDSRGLMLFYESAEGGAGVLRRLVEDADGLAAVAYRAMELCHFDPETGIDLAVSRAGPGRSASDDEACVAACYDCLLSYRNQLDHPLLDRHQALPLLRQLAEATVRAGNGGPSTDDLVAELSGQAAAPGAANADADAGSDIDGVGGDLDGAAEAVAELERRWLETVRELGLRLPDRSHVFFEDLATRPDFVYGDHAVVYVDGSSHQFPGRQKRDADHTAALRDVGYTVIRFGHPDDWAQTFDTYRWVFGDGRQGDSGGSGGNP